MNLHLPSASDIIYFLTVTVLVKYIISQWVANKIMGIFKLLVVRSERHAVYWVHYHQKAIGKTHQYPTPNVCQDGVCKIFYEKQQLTLK